MPTIFISYRREDSAGYAGRLCESLERRLGRQQVFRDVDAIGPGQDFVDAIDARLRECRALLALIGREWLDAADVSGSRRLNQENDYLRLEIAAALARPDVLVVPVLVEGAAMPSPEDLPDSIRSLSRRQAVTLRDDTWDADVDRLVAALGGTSLSRLPKGSKWALLAVAALTVIFVARLFMSADHRVLTDPGQRPRDEAPATSGRQVNTPDNVQVVAISVRRVVINGTCDENSMFEDSVDGEFVFNFELERSGTGRTPIWTDGERPYTRGSHAVSAGITFNRNVTRGEDFILWFRATEYDGLLGADPRLNGVSSGRPHTYLSGRWVASSTSIPLGTASCGATIEWTLSSRPQ